MNGQRAPCSGPSDNQPHVSAITRKIAVLGIGTDDAQISSESWRIMAVTKLGEWLTVVDLRNSE